MLIANVINFLTELFMKMLSFINIPKFPADIMAHLNEYIDLIFNNGTKLLTLFVPIGIVKYGLPLVIAIIAAKYLYYFVMWIIKKIPMAGMS